MTQPPLYRELIVQLRQWIQPKDRRHLTVFAEIVGAMLMTHSTCMSRWLPYLSHRACQGRSHLGRLSYFFSNPEITAEIFYAPLIRRLLAAWAGESMTLVLDTSVLWNQFCLIRVCLDWGGRSIPIAHTVLAHGSATVSFEDYRPVLEAAQALLPPDVQVLFLADRGFEHGELMRWLNRQNWNWAIRAKLDLRVTLAAGEIPMSVVELLPPTGQAHLHGDVEILGDITCNLATAAWPDADEAWAVVSRLPLSEAIFTWYGQRFGGIEPQFKDDKSSAFDLTDSGIRNAESLSRLILVMTVAEFFAIQIGLMVGLSQARTKIDAHTTRGLSFFQLGLRQIACLRHLNQPLPPFKPLPFCNPPPAYASKRKRAAETGKVQFSEVWIFSP